MLHVDFTLIKYNGFIIIFGFFILFATSVNATSIVDDHSIDHDPTKPIYSEINTSQQTIKSKPKEDKVIDLQSIFHSVNKKIATINGFSMEEGDVLDGVVIKKINRDSVVIRFNNRSTELFLSKRIIINGMTGVISE